MTYFNVPIVRQKSINIAMIPPYKILKPSSAISAKIIQKIKKFSPESA